jgi:hypothetical protein
LHKYPAPLVAWKVYAELGDLKLHEGDSSSAQVAFAHAITIVNSIAAHVSDARLQAIFLNSPAVREIVNRAANAKGVTTDH